VAQFAERVGYPLLADPLSGSRHSKAAIARYDLLLRDQSFTSQVVPELVIRIGDLPTSKPLRSWLASLTKTEQLALDPRAARHDPASVVTELGRGDPLAALRASARSGPADPAWLQRWRQADDAASEAIAAALGDELSEPLVAASLGTWLAPDATLFVASSMPIRDVELFFGTRVTGPRVLSNRGANGIDGTVSSAFGTAAASDGSPVVLLIGDVALLHDIGGLLAARRLGLAITIVLINNDGGGIFHFLSVSGEGDAFEQHVATPHGIDFADAAQLYGCGYRRAATVAELRTAVEASIAKSDTTTVIEVRTDREQNLALHHRVAAAALAAL
jgi:2-succinyl-5-enolpyruvyl-6-hydroxy-3-cyclohexene-1-carboxylate synthase